MVAKKQKAEPDIEFGLFQFRGRRMPIITQGSPLGGFAVLALGGAAGAVWRILGGPPVIASGF
jgi:hypothetical protein